MSEPFLGVNMGSVMGIMETSVSILMYFVTAFLISLHINHFCEYLKCLILVDPDTKLSFSFVLNVHHLDIRLMNNDDER